MYIITKKIDLNTGSIICLNMDKVKENFSQEWGSDDICFVNDLDGFVVIQSVYDNEKDALSSLKEAKIVPN